MDKWDKTKDKAASGESGSSTLPGWVPAILQGLTVILSGKVRSLELFVATSLLGVGAGVTWRYYGETALMVGGLWWLSAVVMAFGMRSATLPQRAPEVNTSGTASPHSGMGQ